MESNKDLFKVVRIKTKPKVTKNVLPKNAFNIETKEGNKVLEKCRDYWDGLSQMRLQRRINRDFRNGIQWTASEKEAIKALGGEAIVQNICTIVSRNMVGQYRANHMSPIAIARKRDATEESGMLSLALERAIKINDDDTKDARNLEELMLSGVSCCRVSYSWREELNVNDIKTININPNRLFFNTDLEDSSLSNLHTIGEICDDTLSGMITKFAKTESDKEFLTKIYAGVDDVYGMLGEQTSDRVDNIDFYMSGDNSVCRYYEVWQKELRNVVKYHDYATASMGISEYSIKELAEINEKRIEQALLEGIPIEEVALIDYEEGFEQVWTVKYISHNGYILKSMDSPYMHEQHPYVLLLHSFIDGKIHPLMSDIIPQQRYMNRLIQMIDFAMGRAAKGVLIVPEDCIPEDGDFEDIAKRWSDFNGVIKLNLKAGGQKPEQIVANLTNFGAKEMFDLQLNLAQQIFGVSQAMQGQAPTSGTPASRYLQETQNSSLNSRDLFEMFGQYKVQKYYKMMYIIKQYYTEKIYIQVTGKGSNNNEAEFDPNRVKNLDFDIDCVLANNAPSFQLLQDEQVFKFVEQNRISLESALSISTSPWAVQLLEVIKKEKADAEKKAIEMQQQQMAMQQQAQPQQMGEQLVSPEGGMIDENSYSQAIQQ